MMLKQVAWFTILSLIMTTVSPAQESGQETGLELFSNEVDIVIRVAEPDKTVENIVALVNGAQPGFGAIAKSVIKENLGKVISNPTLTGVDQSRDWYVGIFTQGKGEPQVIFAIPAIETADAVGALDGEFKSIVQGKHVLYTDRGELPPFPTSANSLGSSLNEASKAAFKLGELTIYVNSKHLNTVYKEELDTLYEQVLEGLNQLRFALPQDSGVNMAPVIDMYGAMAEKLLQGVKDSQSLVIALHLNENGVRIEEYLEFGKGSKSSRELAKLPTSEMADLSRLPQGGFAYYGMSGGMKELIKWSVDLTAGMAEDVSGGESLKQAGAKLSDVEFGTLVGSMSFGDAETGFIHATSIAKVDPIEKFRDYMHASILGMQEIKMPGVTQTSTIKKEAETYGDYKADIVVVKQEFEEDGPFADVQKKFQEVLFGVSGMESRVLYGKGESITVMGGGETATKKVVEGLTNSKNDQLETPRSILMEKSNLITLIDFPRSIAGALKIATEQDEFPLPLDAQTIDDLNLTPSFIGMAIAVEENALRVRTDVPMTQIQGIMKLAMLFIGLQNQL